jgi:hypothetical protein
VLTNENKRKDFDLKLNSFNQQKQKERDFQEYQKRKKYEDFQQQEKNSRKFSKNDDKDQKEAKDFNINIRPLAKVVIASSSDLPVQRLS